MRFDDIQTPKVDKVQLVDGHGLEENVVGTLHVTTTHLIFKSDQGNMEIWVANNLIGTVERGAISVAGSPLIVRSKHFRVLHLLISRDKACQQLLETLLKCSRPVNVTELPAFDHRDQPDDSGGWQRLDWSIEFSRQGVSSRWAETSLNSNYSLCDTYPERVWVPSSASQPLLIASSKFRSKGRLPVLTYFHKGSGASLSRCAQPLSGFSTRCLEDEKLMELIGSAGSSRPDSSDSSACSPSLPLLLVDTRPLVNAMVNKVQGKGFEDEKNYTNLRFHFFDIENIHVMRASQSKLVDGCMRGREMSEWLRVLESSGWLRHLRVILDCSLFVAQSLAEGSSVVVHCSDGWDRTSQVVSLAQLLLDPFYRTIHGLQVLIEKDWLGFGYKFADRSAHVAAQNEESTKEVSPIFSQWLDALWQVQRQFPRAFQFNERLLTDLHEHVYSCQFGTFLGNCEKDRKDLNVSKRTKSFWTYMDARLNDYINTFYEPNSFDCLLGVSTRASSLVVFQGLYNRFEDGILPRENMSDVIATTDEHISVLEKQVGALKERRDDLLGTLGLLASQDEENSPRSRQTAEAVNVVAESAICWQSLRHADHCATPTCSAHLGVRSQPRIHCHSCGMIVCQRCLAVDGRRRERHCNHCALLQGPAT